MRYNAIFKDGSQFSLFGSEYFNDMHVFWKSHQSNLIRFSAEVCKKGRPIKVIDNENEIVFNNELEFDNWYKMNQSQQLDFGFSHLTDNETIFDEGKVKIDKMIEFLETELNDLKTKPFDPWKHDGGYKELDQLCHISIISLEIINSKIGLNDKLRLIKTCFETPIKFVIDNHNILTYRKKLPHERIDPKKLISFCEGIITEIDNKIKAL
ncbi:hypothetical protein [Tenacibaculum discolor]|uniref:hypothetical protein n=1 Tax=Tenacibaculum discolor TaxID=361581 RepID=UPI003F7971CE